MNNIERNSTEQENNNAQLNTNISMNMQETRTDGQSVTTETMPTEQANVQLPTAEGDVDQQNEETAQEPSYVETLLSLVGDKLPKKMKFAIMYSEAKKAGLKVVFLTLRVKYGRARMVCSMAQSKYRPR